MARMIEASSISSAAGITPAAMMSETVSEASISVVNEASTVLTA
jgi:hypothetical protein